MNCITDEALRRARDGIKRPGWPLSVGPGAASGIEAPSGGETTEIGSTEGAFEVSISHPAQDKSLSDEERKYAGDLSHLYGRELATHAQHFEGYALDQLGVPPAIANRVMVHGHKHRCAMIAAHMIANARVNDATADKLAEELAADFLKLLKWQIPESCKVVERLDRERGGTA